MCLGHALHSWNISFCNFIIHKVLSQLLQATSITEIHVQSTQSIVLKVPHQDSEFFRCKIKAEIITFEFLRIVLYLLVECRCAVSIDFCKVEVQHDLRATDFVYFVADCILSEQFHSSQQQVNQVAVEDAVVVIEIVRHVHSDDNLLEEILGKHQRCQLGGFFFIGIHTKG